MKLDRTFFSEDPSIVARKLLGKVLVKKTPEGTLKGKVVETEAYYSKDDPASHFQVRPSSRDFFREKPSGTIYVYFTYGNHWMFNILAKGEDKSGAVLIRALEPAEGIDIMKRHRKVKKDTELTSGPAKLTQAFQINGSYNGKDITEDENIYFEDAEEISDIVITSRIGIKEGKDMPLRFYVKGNRFVSKK
ncbi:MAG: DNA-3-methyladenine glycosylase [Candidatus Freyarchaeota archaeon]|nr:DNA-3-methyladenine glycosylase [Candidatus Jordarchaeia archaeon]MBS7278885.1 DNA-3-methyladenine glycosylase [Candidatus Jordarchaeia archaeon]